MRWYSRFFLLALVVMLGACSSTTFIYNRLDFVLPWYMGKYVDLTGDQKQVLDELLTPYLDWHRNEELPVYLAIMEDMEGALDRPLTMADMKVLDAHMQDGWARLEARTLDWMLELGEQLSDAQVREFIAELREKQAEYEEEYLERDEEEYREDAYEDMLDGAKMFLGRLEWGQRAELETAAASLYRLDDVWLRERADWLDRIEELLQREPGWQQGFRDMLGQRDKNVLPEYQEIYEHNLVTVQKASLTVLNNRTEKQDRKLRKKLGSLQKDLATLIEQGRKKSAG